ncbi:hypothetical protein WJX73_009488 [Symbiochloris irregularis]|uniref:MYND-type domain-containing protein n=1 Tax=Symbiochloris irregularis TaxID=706552 RepID=A0AAW1PJ65_9CHLO
MQFLVANAARLDDKYKQRCRKEWNLEDTPFDVSFLVCAGLPDEVQTKSLETQCANLFCAQPAHAKCSRCKSASYCNKECQKMHWRYHKARCNSKAAALPSQERTAAQSAAKQREEAAERAAHGPSMIVQITEDAVDQMRALAMMTPTVQQGAWKGKTQDIHLPNVYGDKRFLVKVELSMDEPGPHTVHDASSFSIDCRKDQPAFSELDRVV